MCVMCVRLLIPQKQTHRLTMYLSIRRPNNRHGCVINVSSGDGELAYLHSVAAKRLRVMRSLEVHTQIGFVSVHVDGSITSLYPSIHSQIHSHTHTHIHEKELERYAAKVVSKQAPGAVWPRHGIAHLTWPAYCFSKAALNAATRLLHEEEAAHARAVAGTEDDRMRGRFRHGERSVRIVAVCPGDVATGACVPCWGCLAGMR